jgi:hypothetical protein
MTIEATRLALEVDPVHTLGKGMPQTVEQSICIGEKAPSFSDRLEMVGIRAGLAAGLDEGAQGMTCITIALIGQDNEEATFRSEEARHAHHAALKVGDEEEHVQRQAEIDASVAGKFDLLTPRDIFHLVEACDESYADFEIASRLYKPAIAIDVVWIWIFEVKPRARGESIGRKRQGLAVAATEVEYRPRLGEEVDDRLAQLRHEEIALISAEHQHTAEWIPFQQARERIAILLMCVQAGELVGDNVHRLVEAGRQAARLRSIDPTGDCHFETRCISLTANAFDYSRLYRRPIRDRVRRHDVIQANV